MAVNTNKQGTFRYAGIPIRGNTEAFNDIWFVDCDLGSDSNAGKKPTSAFKTIQVAVTTANKYDTIYVKPSGDLVYNTNDYAEPVVIPYAKPGIKIIGCANNAMEGILWTVGTTNDDILTVNSRDCYVEGFRFRPNGATSNGIVLNKWVGAAADAESGYGITDASGFTAKNCAFRSTGTDGRGIWMADSGYSEGANDVSIIDCVFDNCIGALKCQGPATIPSRLYMKNIRIANCDVGIQGAFRRSTFEKVYIADLSAGMMLDTDSGGSTDAKNNIIIGCVFGDAESSITEVNSGTTDTWAGSFFGDTDNVAATVAITSGLFILAPNGATST